MSRIAELKKEMGFKETPRCCGNCFNCNKWNKPNPHPQRSAIQCHYCLEGEFRVTATSVCDHWKPEVH